MADFLSDRQRSNRMRSITSKNTKPELRLRKELFRRGYRYRLHRADLPGKPDIVLPKYKTVIQVRGCFWHQHDCRDGHIPSSKKGYWEPKLKKNVERDRMNDAALIQRGWKLIVVWECEIRSNKKLSARVSDVVQEIRSTYRL